jgi:hypothetical protein
VYFSDDTWVANTLGSDLSSFTGSSGQTYEFYVLANSPSGVQSVSSNLVSATLPPVCSPTASLEVSINGGPFAPGNPQAIRDTDTIDLQWSSTDSFSCVAIDGPGFSTGSGNPTSGIDSVDRPARGATETYEVDCDGATASIEVSTAYPNLRATGVTPNPSSGVDQNTGAYNILEIASLIEEVGNLSGTGGVSIQGTIDLDRGNDGTWDNLGNPLNMGNYVAGQAVTVTDTFNNVLPGEHRVRVTVDTTDAVDEGPGESDNVQEFVINVAMADPNVQINANPSQVRPSGQVTLTWDADIYYPYPDMECTVVGPGGINETNVNLPDSLLTPDIVAKSVYTLTCTHLLGGPFIDTAEIDTVGSLEEI